jgi:hypothetical protein
VGGELPRAQGLAQPAGPAARAIAGRLRRTPPWVGRQFRPCALRAASDFRVLSVKLSVVKNQHLARGRLLPILSRQFADCCSGLCAKGPPARRGGRGSCGRWVEIAEVAAFEAI